MRSEFKAMGTRVTLVSDTSGIPRREINWLEIERIHHLTRVWFLKWERIFSRFLPDSELTRLNQQAGSWTEVSLPMWEVLSTALRGARETGGVVTPLMLPQLVSAGYDRSFEQLPMGCMQDKGLEDLEIRPTLPDVEAWQQVQLDAEMHKVFTPSGFHLDLGGYAKGWAADTTARLLGEYSPCLVDTGGDIRISGPRTSGKPWRVAIAHPLHPGENLCVLELGEAQTASIRAIATSSPLIRRWHVGSGWNHHLIDPRTGQPAVSDLLQVTVLGTTTLQAEIAAKAVFILGGEKGLTWLEAHSEMVGILVYVIRVEK